MSADSITRLVWLVPLSYFFVTAFYRGNPDGIEKQIYERLQVFKHVKVSASSTIEWLISFV